MRALMTAVASLFLLNGASAAPPIAIDPERLSLELVGDDWQIRSGTATLKNFGRAYPDAQEALRIVRTLRADAFGRIGPPGTFEYWLVDGKAPPPFPTRGRVRSFQLDKVELKDYQGIWYLGDDRGVLFNFGPSRSDAETDLAICRRYEFNGFVAIGGPKPRMTVMFRDPQPGLSDLPPQRPVNPLMRYVELTDPLLMLPEIGCVGRKIEIDPRKLDVRFAERQWRLFHDTEELAAFGSSQLDAMQAERTIRDGRVTEMCPLTGCDIWLPLSWGRLRAGVPLGVTETRLEPDRLKVEHHPKGWMLSEEGRAILGPIRGEAEAKTLLAVIRHLGADRLAQIGPDSGGLRFLTKSR